jgi:polyhydroxybutyrate depolymerase
MMSGMPHRANRRPRIPVLVLTAAMLAVLAGCRALPARGAAGPSSGGADQARWLESGGLRREYLIHLPVGASSAAGLPVVIAFHGRLGTAQGMSTLTHLDRVADQHRFAVVYPQGYQRSWDDGRPNTPAHRHGVDDVAFVSALIRHLVAADQVDASRIYATGISNGAMLTERLGCELAGQLAGIAPVAGPMPVVVAGSCHPVRPIAMLEIHGTADPLVPYGGGQVRGGGRGDVVTSVPSTFARWRAIDRCGEPPTTASLPDRAHDGTQVSVARGTSCAAGAPVVLYTVTGAGHTWPGGVQYLPEMLIGATSGQFDASEVIWQFFSGQRRVPLPAGI